LNKKYYQLIGVLITILGSICFSGKAILVKIVYRNTAIDTISLLSLRMLFSLPFFIGIAVLQNQKNSNILLTKKEWIHIGLIGFMGYYLSSYLDFLGLKFISAGLERVILFTYPTIVVLLAYLFHKKKINSFQSFALLLSYIGIAIAFMADVAQGSNSNVPLGSILIFLCAIAYAIYVFGSGMLIPKIGAAKFTSLAMIASTIAILAHYLIEHRFKIGLFSFEPQVYYYSIVMAVFTTVLPTLLVSEGIKRIGSSNVAIVSSIGPVSTLLQAYFFLKEAFGWQQILGTILVIVGVILLGSNISKKQITKPYTVS
jgi:drug/metabolite transporter (DMT)-like permease